MDYFSGSEYRCLFLVIQDGLAKHGAASILPYLTCEIMLSRLLTRICRTWYFPAFWTLLTVVLLCLPGSAIPSHGLFGIKNLDKVVHVFLFGGIVLFWGLNALMKNSRDRRKKARLVWGALFSIGLGVALEFIQRDYIPNRTFDPGDILADAVGSLAVLSLLFWRFRRRAS